MGAGDAVGSAEWVGDRLRALPPRQSWGTTDASHELISWLYAVARHRARVVGVAVEDRAEVAQDAMPAVVSALNRSRESFARAANPAAVLERVVARAVSCGAHRLRMRGLGGVSANGRNWDVPYPRSIGGDVAVRLIEEAPEAVHRPSHRIEDAADVIFGWVNEHVGVALTEDGAHAVIYVLDRVISGHARAALVRGNRVGLASDPAMFYLGFDPRTARVFAAWLLGRNDPGHERPSVLDAALLGVTVAPEDLMAWRRTSLDAGFAREQTNAGALRLPA